MSPETAGFALPEGEPQAGPWRSMSLVDLLERLLRPVGERPFILAIDGRGAAGKSTLARDLAAAHGKAGIVHTDDIAWHEPHFGWGDLLLEQVLLPLHRGEAVSYRPAAWEQRGRAGCIEVPEGAALVIIEGTGASHREHADLIDATIWVQSDFGEAERRGIERDVVEGVNGDRTATTEFWHEWMSHELVFFRDQRPWERAALVVTGTPPLELGPGEVAVADPPAGREPGSTPHPCTLKQPGALAQSVRAADS